MQFEGCSHCSEQGLTEELRKFQKPIKKWNYNYLWEHCQLVELLIKERYVVLVIQVP
ncbi:unnamed protein product, partial [Vitis vinifera]|uniref:Uncharacterized protein n=1 Tax=Vitis vinifera TaxID=29760 RepID=E0CU48_VITVI